MASNVEGEYLIGSKAEEHRGLLKVEYPMEHGIVTRWEDMERIWRHTFKQLGVQSEDVRFYHSYSICVCDACSFLLPLQGRSPFQALDCVTVVAL